MNFLHYVLQEIKSRRLSHTHALDLMRQYHEGGAGRGAPEHLHPLLQRNVSTLAEQRFCTEFNGDEPWLADHLVRGMKVLPGAAHLEMACEAVRRALELPADAFGITLEAVVFERPIALAEAALTVWIALTAQADGTVSFEILTEAGDDEIVHSRGRVRVDASAPPLVTEQPPVLDGAQEIATADCYAAFARMGLQYGPAHQVLRSVRAGRDAQGRRTAVARIALPECVDGDRAAYLLHPSLLDGALQAGIGLASDAERANGERLLLPWTIDRLHVFAPLPPTATVIVRESGDSNDTVRKFDLSVVGPEGRLVARLDGYGSRVVARVDAAQQTVLLAPAWQPTGDARLASGWAHHLVLLAGLPSPDLAARVRAVLPDAECVELHSAAAATADRYADLAAQLLARLQALLAAHPAGRLRVQLALPDDDEADGLLHGLSGMLKSAHLEHPRVETQQLRLDAARTVDEMAAGILRQADRAEQDLRERSGVWQRAGFDAVDAAATTRPCWATGDVVLITGGAGGLGRLCADALVEQGCKVMLAGRSAPDDAQRAWLSARADALDYQQVDVTDAAATQRLVAAILARHGRLDGVFHAAGVLRDGALHAKTAEDLRAVLAAKVGGLINLDEATRDTALKHFVLFSSMVAVLGNAGQADYAAANGFMDAYAHRRNRLAAQGRRHGRTVAVNWPLWADGGMRMSAGALEQMQTRAGVTPLPAAAGLAALEQALALGVPQLAVMHGDAGRIRRTLLDATPAPADATPDAADVSDAGELRGQIQAALTARVAEQLKFKLEDLDGETSLDEFGFDSVSLTTFANTLNQCYGLELTPTVLFEHSTLARLAEYLALAQRAAMLRHFSVAGPARTRGEEAAATPMPPIEPTPATRRSRRGRMPAPVPPVGACVAGTANALAEPVAIIGVSGCFPQAADIDAFWANLEAGRDCIGEMPAHRWDADALAGGSTAGASLTRQVGVIDGLDEFDPQFFGISPREAETMDPQQRLLMTHVWAAIEDAGYAAQSLSGSRTALIIGTSASGYSALLRQAGEAIEGYSSTGAVASVGPNRMSFLLNLHGPSEPVETACSSSLVAIHRAVELLQSGQCTLAVAGGVNTLISSEIHVSFGKAGMLSPDGRCKTFSDQANGYVRGEGVGMLVLKPLSAAERDGDRIYALVRATAENHGGKANSLTAPNPRAQADLIKTAIRQAGVDPATIGYIEAHGTGTSLGDPIEVQGLKTAFQELAGERGETLPEARCGIGSVKTNIGHLELAAGVAGVIKVLMQMRHRTLAPSLHCDTLNPYVELDGSPFYVVREKREWLPVHDAAGRPLPRRAGVSSFGFGGVNAHVVLEEYVAGDVARAASGAGPVLIVLSARNDERLRERARQLLDAIERQGLGQADLADLAYTLQAGRDAMEARLACVVGTIDELRHKLARYLADEAAIENLYRGEAKRQKELVAVFAADEELQEAIGKWIRRGKLGKLAELWVKGVTLDWSQLYGATMPRRIGLPTYPFARERYWVPQDGARAVAATAGAAALHPLLQRNSSTLSEQRFSTTFTGQEFFLAEHVVRGARVLPGVAQLEMARAAACMALELDERAPVGIRDRGWASAGKLSCRARAR
ncbi:SDR family NAD(P)-dependent oxidoreductase [Burkholderia ubonensis]|uniref:Uncharacterized protein n=1 Tax=Burkholderia ubonensis TaxID=101571 RepID=A0A1R1J7F8_9BURK|nr:SDR family NAD(P)-dependent oxidoreductase [Burkholderia ubonensis]OMG71011.1 hypothetical protein BW685_23360 [Burkholderia ubonensis]